MGLHDDTQPQHAVVAVVGERSVDHDVAHAHLGLGHDVAFAQCGIGFGIALQRIGDRRCEERDGHPVFPFRGQTGDVEVGRRRAVLHISRTFAVDRHLVGRSCRGHVQEEFAVDPCEGHGELAREQTPRFVALLLPVGDRAQVARCGAVEGQRVGQRGVGHDLAAGGVAVDGHRRGRVVGLGGGAERRKEGCDEGNVSHNSYICPA